MNCITAIPVLIAWMVLAVTTGVGSHAALITGITGLVFAAIGLLTIAGAQRMIRLQSYGLAVMTGIIQLIPTPGFIVGVWIGIWALVVLTRNEVHKVFVEVTESGDAGDDSTIGKITLAVLSVASSFNYLIAFAELPDRGRFHWTLFLFGPLIAILDIYAFGKWTGRPEFGPRWLWGRIRAEVEKITGRK